LTHRRHPGDGDRGQAAIELALALPVVLVLAVAAAQFGALGLRQLAIGNAARAGARAGSVAADPVAAATAAALAATSVRPLDVDVAVGDGTVRVTVRTTSRVGVGPAGREVDLSASVSMRLEPP
jgi:Flp pilus assembly protein TadG